MPETPSPAPRDRGAEAPPLRAPALVLALAATLALSAPAVRADLPVLTVYTYDSFASEWGPGPAIEAGFEAACGCDLQLEGLDSSIGAFQRLRLEGAASPADVLIGLDLSLVEEARESGLFAPHGQDLGPLATPVPWDDPVFAPLDWGHFAFVYDSRRLADPPSSFEDLMALPDDVKIVIQDPRSSTPGLGLLFWVRAVYGERAGEAWRRLAPRILTVTAEWWDAYSLFLEGEAEMVLSYTTSPAYHRIAEGETAYRAARFAEGHYLQMELAAVTAASDQPDLARAFIAHLAGAEVQALLPTTNWMYPVRAGIALPEGFEAPLPAAGTLFLSPAETALNRRAWIDEWLAALGR